jgi:hypothetical protein
MIMGSAYLKNTLDQRVTDKPYFIDKMPNNFIHIGLDTSNTTKCKNN